MTKKRILQGIFLLFVSVLFAAGAYLYARYGRILQEMQNTAQKTVAESTEDTFRQTETSMVYDIDGNLISTLKGEKDVYYVQLRDIPTETIDAIISAEDKQFYRHSGLDIKGIARAAWALVRNKGEITQGGSTITQQLARNIFLSHEETWERKIREMFLALALEKKYSKADIMEFYLNNIYFANGYYGIQAASMGYFSRSVQELSLSEQVFLCSIPNSPNRYDPYQHFEDTLARRDRILEQMYADGKLKEEQLNEAKQETIVLCRTERKKNSDVETFAYDQAVRALMKRSGFAFQYVFDSEEEEQSYREDYSSLYTEYQRSLYTAGYRIYTSINQDMQELLQQAVDEALSEDEEQKEDGVFALQGAAVTIDNDTGRVVAIVGGRTQELAGYTLNRAYQSFRQPGSAIKPLIVYTPSFERGYLPQDIVHDEKTEGGPRNVDGVYSGDITIKQAVAVSKNTIAWNLFAELTEEVGLSYLLDMNFSNISAADYYPAASLGGFSTGVSTLEMTSGFATLANQGVFREPTCIIKIMDAEGTVLVSDLQMDEKRIYTEDAVKKMNLCLTEVVKSGTAKRAALSNMPCAGKTGTTSNKKDKWFVGFTAYYTTGVWIGYDMPRSLSGLSSTSEPLAIWKNYMETIHEGKDPIELSLYTEPEIQEIITPDQGLTDEGDASDDEVIPEENIPDNDLQDETDDPFENDAEEDWDEEIRDEENWDEENWDEENWDEEIRDEEWEDPGDEAGEEPPENPTIGPEDLSPEDYRFFYGG